MEALSAAQDDSSGANPSSIKSDDSSPRPDSRAGSPPPNCAICLGTCKNKSFTDSCLHQFCFTCLLTWSKVKAECPLCKQAFRSIIHNVRSNHQYEEYLVVQRQNEEVSSRIDIDRVTAATHRFRYRTTLTLPRRQSIAFEELLRQYTFMADAFPPPGARLPPARRRRSPASFRRTVYRHNLWARPLPDFTGRFRDCTPDFYRYNNTQMHRLVPWLSRELNYLLNENVGHINYVMSRIVELLPQHHINSSEFREAMHRYFGDRTEHFLHELYCFASTPYDMTGYDRNVQYTTDSRISTMVNEVISSSESDASVDSDIVMVSSSEPAEPPPGPSRFPATSRIPLPEYPRNILTPSMSSSLIPIETISHSDTDDDSSEVMVVGYIKPPQERTPEIVDLLGSDSDVIVQDNPQPEQIQPAPSQEYRQVPSVKVTLKRHRPRGSGEERPSSSDSDDAYRPPLRRRRRTRPGASDSSASHSASSTPDQLRASASAASTSLSSSSAAATASSTTTTTTTTTSTTTTTTTSTTDDDTDHSNFVVTKKSKKKSSKESVTSSRDRRRNKKRSSRSYHKEKKNVQDSEKDKRNKRKSYSGKGVKSSKKTCSNELNSVPQEPLAALDQPGTSGTSSRDRHKTNKERKQKRRDSRENRRLRSVVNVMYNIHKNTEESNSSGNYSNLSNPASNDRSDVESPVGVFHDRADEAESTNGLSGLSVMGQMDSSSDSEDNLPLNLTLQNKKKNPFSPS